MSEPTRETVLDLLMGAARGTVGATDEEMQAAADALEDMVAEGEIVEVTP